MKALYYDGTITLRTGCPRPVPGPGESLLRIRVAAVCNTDKEVARGYKSGFAGVMGHEFVAEVLQSPDPALVGRRVVGEINAGCGDCIYCDTGREGHCLSRRVIGMAGANGCFADYMVLQAHRLHAVPDGLSDGEAVYTEPLAAALQLLEQHHIPPSAQVAVVGDGRLAYLCAQVLALNGAAVTVFGRHPEKLALFAAFAQTTTEPAGSFETVVEATGSPGGMETAASLVRARGTILLKSTYAGKAHVDMSRFVVNEVTIKGSRCGPFAPALRLLASGAVKVPPLEFYRLEDYKEAFASTAFKAAFDLREG